MTDPHAHPQHHVHETAPLHDRPDEWHDHSGDEKPQHAHAEVGNAALIITTGLGLFLMIVASVVAVYAFYINTITRQLEEQEQARLPTSPALITHKMKVDTIEGLERKDYSWVVAPAAGDQPPRAMVQLPLEIAKQRVMKSYGFNKE